MFITVTHCSLQQGIECAQNNMHRDARKLRHGGAFPPLSFQKGGSGGGGAFSSLV